MPHLGEPGKDVPCPKHGLDDHLAHGVTGKRGGTVDQLVVVERDLPWTDLDAWILELEIWDAKGATPRQEARDRNTVVLRWLAMYASAKEGWNTVAFRTIAEKLGLEETKVKRAVSELSPRYKNRQGKMVPGWGCVETKDIHERARNFATGSTEWVGYVEVHPDLRATTRKLSLREHERMLART